MCIRDSTLNNHDLEKPGLDFLGFNIRHYPVGKHQGNKYGNHKLLIKPSKEKIDLHYQRIKQIVRKSHNLSVKALIEKLNPIMREWANYYQYVVSSRVLQQLDNKIYCLQRIWCQKKHPKKGKKYLKNRYLKAVNSLERLFHQEDDLNWHLLTYRVASRY